MTYEPFLSDCVFICKAPVVLRTCTVAALIIAPDVSTTVPDSWGAWVLSPMAAGSFPARKARLKSASWLIQIDNEVAYNPSLVPEECY